MACITRPYRALGASTACHTAPCRASSSSSTPPEFMEKWIGRLIDRWWSSSLSIALSVDRSIDQFEGIKSLPSTNTSEKRTRGVVVGAARARVVYVHFSIRRIHPRIFLASLLLLRHPRPVFFGASLWVCECGGRSVCLAVWTWTSLRVFAIVGDRSTRSFSSSGRCFFFR